ncbi:MAG: tRNA threonylcarbamoyladenosine dehydratase [Alphaproteobacteria bacterium]|nr:tRNA threonylcarbamoyladenosine dehydratase [Alphaproteobacteria bacterium]MCB9692137.1 tRNA threonylcarbamoyladenosine dehydratase [Alphaproteobacteria bacterium]MCB9700177.1 tRNA threonylcarbamoyladenosine dehydratase [Alphaproteobacteria bacterium]
MRKMHPFHRTELLVGGEGYDTLAGSFVTVVGLGGVGSYAAEALVRSGVGRVRLVDFDRVCVTNVNRQLHATRKTVGESKAELMGERCTSINPKATIEVLPVFYEESTDEDVLGDAPDLVLDCIDNMKAKIQLLSSCHRRGLRVISAMGAGGRMDPTRVKVSDLSETRIDPFAKIVRDLLRKEHGVESGIECVWTDEPPNDLDAAAQAAFRCICTDRDNGKHSCDQRLQVQGSVAWMPSIFGLTMAGTAVHRLLGLQLASDVRPTPRMKAMHGKLSNARKKELIAAVREATP